MSRVTTAVVALAKKRLLESAYERACHDARAALLALTPEETDRLYAEMTKAGGVQLLSWADVKDHGAGG